MTEETTTPKRVNSWAGWAMIFSFFAFFCYFLAIWTSGSVQDHFVQSGLAATAFALLLAVPGLIVHVRNRP